MIGTEETNSANCNARHLTRRTASKADERLGSQIPSPAPTFVDTGKWVGERSRVNPFQNTSSPSTYHIPRGTNNWSDITESYREMFQVASSIRQKKQTGTISLPAGGKQSVTPKPATVLHTCKRSTQEEGGGVSLAWGQPGEFQASHEYRRRCLKTKERQSKRQKSNIHTIPSLFFASALF